MNESMEFAPYVGPTPFESNDKDSARFFGRSRETEEIVSLIFGHPLTLVYAQSGAGKTSLFNAGVTPALREEGFDVLPPTRVGGVVPEGIVAGDVENLYVFNALLYMEGKNKTGKKANPQDLVSKSLSSYLATHPRKSVSGSDSSPRVMFFDQFEELFTYTPEKWREQRDGFFRQVMDALEADPLLRIVFIIREDYLAQLDPYAQDLSERLRIRYRLERLQEEAAIHAIKDPLKESKWSFAPGVAEGLVKDLLNTRTVDAAGEMVEIEGQYVEPVQLQVVCVTLWSELSPKTKVFTQEDLKDFKVNIALSDFYTSAIESTVKETGVEEQKLREWFGKTLITPMGTRNTVFHDATATGGISNRAVDFLEDHHHIIRAEYRAGVRWYELTHDRFIDAILANNKEWNERRRKEIGNPLTEPAQEWKRLNKDKGSLLRGALLDELSAWDEENPNELDELEREYLEASKQNYQDELEAKAQSEKRLRTLVIGLGVALIFAIGAIFIAFNRANLASKAQADAEAAQVEAIAAQAAAISAASEASTQRALAEEQAEAAKEAEAQARSSKLAIQSISSLKADPQLSLLLAVEAINIRHTAETDDTLRQALQASQTKAILSLQNNVTALAFSNDGRYLVTGNTVGVLTLWDAATNTAISNWGGDEQNNTAINSIVFDPDGISFVTGRSDGSVDIWPMNTLRIPNLAEYYFRLDGLSSNIRSLAFSPDGNLVAAASEDGSAFVWDIDEPKNSFPLNDHSAQVNALAFSPASDRIVTASSDTTAIVWEAGTGRKLATLAGHTAIINAVNFALDGSFIATASDDGTVRLWFTETGQLAATLSHFNPVTKMIIAPESGLLITASSDNNLRLWDLDDAISNRNLIPTEVRTGHEDRITSLTLSPDGQYLTTTSADSTARLWKVPSGELQAILRGHSSSVNAVTFTPDSTLLATTSSDNTIRIWNTYGSEIQKTIPGNQGSIWDIAIDPNGKFMATKGEDATILWNLEKVLDPESTDDTSTIIDGPGIGWGVEFNSTGSLLATTSMDEDEEAGTISIWDVSKSPDLQVLPVSSQNLPGEIAINLAFGHNGDLLIASTVNSDFGNGALNLWAITSNGFDEEIVLSRFVGQLIYGLAFNPDETLLAASIANQETETGSIYIWNVNDLITEKSNVTEIAIIPAPEAPILIAFSPDGKLLATGAFDGTIRLWDVASLVSAGNTDAQAVLSGHEEIVVGLTFSPDGSRLASASQDGTVRIWDVSTAIQTGGEDAEVSIFREQGGFVYGVAYSPDGDWLITAGEEELIYLWPLSKDYLVEQACERAIRNLTLTEWNTYFGRGKEYERTCANLPYHPSVLEGMVERGVELVWQENVEEALEIWNEVLELDPEFDLDIDSLLAEIYVEQGREFAKQGDYEKALDILHKAAELAPDLMFETPEETVAELLVESVEQFVATGKYDQALEVMQKANELDPTLELEPEADLAEALFDLGSQYFDSGDYERALEALNKAVELDPTLANAEAAEELVAMGRELARNGESDWALATLNMALEFDPTLELIPEAEIAIGQAYVHASLGEYEQALSSLRQANQLDPSLNLDPEAILAEILTEPVKQYVYEGNYTLALGSFQQVTEITPALNKRITFGETISDMIEDSDGDLWVFDGTAGQIVTIEMNDDDSGLDTYLQLLSPDGELIRNGEFGDGSPNSQIAYELPETGLYFILAGGYSYETGTYAGAYILTVTVTP